MNRQISSEVQTTMIECKLCGSKKDLQCHHISYEPEITQILCINCHFKVHGKNHGVGVPIGSIQERNLIVCKPPHTVLMGKPDFILIGKVSKFGNSLHIIIPKRYGEWLGSDRIEIAIYRLETTNGLMVDE